MADSQSESIRELENDIAQIIISQDEIMDRVNVLGRTISEDYNGKDLILVGVLRGGTVLHGRPDARHHHTGDL